VALYDGDLSGAVSFEPKATADADRFAGDGIEPRLASGSLPDDEPPLVVIATDGELYGHHQPFRELFLERLVQPSPDRTPRGYDIVPLDEALAEPAGHPFRTIQLMERTSWSCHHGVLRWSGECPCVTDGRWKGPLRAAVERLAAGIDVVTAQVAAGLAGSPDPWAARDTYVDVVIGAEDGATFAARWLGGSSGGAASDTEAFLAIMEAQRWRLAMFASDGWYWDDPARSETASVLRAAARAARLVDGLVPTDLERRHDYLWRVDNAVPPAGMIGVFNRSHYESVLVERVRELAPRRAWSVRYRQINDFERRLSENGVVVLKFMLHVSHDEQRKRFLERLHEPLKNWKLQEGDLEDRDRWTGYTRAYRDALRKCNTRWARWWVVPADSKSVRNYLVAKVVCDTLQWMKPEYPLASKRLRKLVRKRLG